MSRVGLVERCGWSRLYSASHQPPLLCTRPQARLCRQFANGLAGFPVSRRQFKLRLKVDPEFRVNPKPVAEAAVIAAKHDKWDERPLLIVVPKQGKTIDDQAMLDFYKGKVAKWWIPDAVKIVEEIPKGATGKILKTALREKFSDALLTAN